METNQNLTADPKYTLPIDTNAEYISAKGIHDQPPIITSVFRSIFVEIPREFYLGIKNFLLRFANLFKDGFKYLKYPSLKIDPFATKDYKDNCQQTFEFILIVTALLIFLIKLDWIYGDEVLKAAYNNDITQAMMQFLIFIIFAVSYFVLILLSVLMGRLFRNLFKIPVTRQEGDILFTYLNNILFLITVSIAFFIRCIVPVVNVADNEGNAEDWVVYTLLFSYLVIFGRMIFKWTSRLALLNNIRTGKVSFQIIVTTVTGFIFAFCSTMITLFIWGV